MTRLSALTCAKGVKFHSGNELTADDVVWTFERLTSVSRL